MKHFFAIWSLCSWVFCANAQIFITPETPYGVPDSLEVKTILDYKFPDAQSMQTLLLKQGATEGGNVLNYTEDNKFYGAFKYSDEWWLALHMQGNGEVSLVSAAPLPDAGPNLWALQVAESRYGAHAGTGTMWYIVLSVDALPKQLMAIAYGCWTEEFGTVENPDAGSMEQYERFILVDSDGITVGDINNNPKPDDCHLTLLPTGTYILQNGKLIRKM